MLWGSALKSSRKYLDATGRGKKKFILPGDLLNISKTYPEDKDMTKPIRIKAKIKKIKTKSKTAKTYPEDKDMTKPIRTNVNLDSIKKRLQGKGLNVDYVDHLLKKYNSKKYKNDRLK